MTRVTVAINNLNYGRYLGAAIDSVLGQTWGDVEIVVVDNGSTDETRDVVASYGERIRPLFQDDKRQGAAISRGYEMATGDLVLFLDADDTLHPDAAAEIVEAHRRHPGAARIQWPMAVIDKQGRPTGELTPDPAAMASGDLAEHVLRFRTHVWPATSGSAYRRSALVDLMPVPEDFFQGVDLYLAETTPFYGEVVTIRRPLSNYRRHGENTWLHKRPDGAYLRTKIDWTVRTHTHVVEAARANGYTARTDPRAALDVAFICVRLASLRVDRANHPFPDDKRLRLTARGVWAALRHPHHTVSHKAKRVVWILGVGLGPTRLARKLVTRFYA